MKKALLLLFLVIGSSLAQTLTHSVTLTWTDTNNPVGTTYNVKRAIGLCTGTPTFATLATAITTKTYTDSTVTPGNYCYTVTATFSGAESVNSNLVNPSVPSFPVTVTYTVQ